MDADAATLTGRDLDAEVWRAVFGCCPHGWDLRPQKPGGWSFHVWICKYCGEECRADCVEDRSAPHYSTQIADAWLIVEKMRSRGFRFTLEELDHEPPWTATFSMPDINGMGDPVHWYESGETAPAAIARAGLAAVRGIKEAKADG